DDHVSAQPLALSGSHSAGNGIVLVSGQPAGAPAASATAAQSSGARRASNADLRTGLGCPAASSQPKRTHGSAVTPSGTGWSWKPQKTKPARPGVQRASAIACAVQTAWPSRPASSDDQPNSDTITGTPASRAS